MKAFRTFPIAGIGAALIFQSLGTCGAAEFHLTPEGAGARDGSSWENAFDQSALSTAVNERLQPGDRLNVGGGTYRDVELVIRTGGQEGKPKTIAGVDRGAGLPVFAGTWSADKPTKGRTALLLGPGVSHLAVRGLRLRGYTFCVLAKHEGGAPPRSHLVFDDVDMEQCRHGFYLSDCDDLALTGCDLKRYTKHGFRFDQGCDRVELRRCTADCSEGDAEWEKKTELFPFGFTITDGGAPNTRFVFEDCMTRNNMMPGQTTRYKNGDGFVMEGNTRDVVLRRCRSIRNQDGGFDLKVPGVQLTDCVAVGNKRGFRIWTTGALTNCFAGWNISSLWCKGGPVDATRCTFHAASGATVTCEDEAKRPVTLRDCILSAAPEAKSFQPTGHKLVVLETTVLCGPNQPPPDYVRPDPGWDGTGDAMDSRAFPDQGWSSRRVPAP